MALVSQGLKGSAAADDEHDPHREHDPKTRRESEDRAPGLPTRDEKGTGQSDRGRHADLLLGAKREPRESPCSVRGQEALLRGPQEKKGAERETQCMDCGRAIREHQPARSGREDGDSHEETGQNHALNEIEVGPAHPEKKNARNDCRHPIGKQEPGRRKGERPPGEGKEIRRKGTVLKENVAVVALSPGEALRERPPDSGIAGGIEPAVARPDSGGRRDGEKQRLGTPTFYGGKKPTTGTDGDFPGAHARADRRRTTASNELPNGSGTAPRVFCSNRDIRKRSPFSQRGGRPGVAGLTGRSASLKCAASLKGNSHR